MISFLNALTTLTRQKDLLLVIVFVTILMMMILPLPTMVMDLLITLNISAGIIILLVALHLHSPVQFSTFPSVLLVTTLFRLAISISTTRLILIEGDAGKIVETFGKVVVSGNLVVGMVIFLIITVVQFLVITKGADRVAEVGARFTLDGMPGKQMAVDADVRAGTLDQVDAKQARGDLEREAKLFGSMDGAMKFVKGDAIAGLVITAINLLGGIAIGMLQLGMDFSQALSLYALLTIGDGLVAQIPALLISVAAGTIVTRVTNPVGMDLGAEISEQITSNRRTMMSAGLVIALFGFVPGFPTLIFVSVGLTMAGSIWWLTRKQQENSAKALIDWKYMHAQHKSEWDDKLRRTGQKPSLRIKLPAAALLEEAPTFWGSFCGLNHSIESVYGVDTGYWSYDINNTELESFEIYIEGELVATDTLDSELIFVKANASYLKALEVPIIRHLGANEGVFVHKQYRDELSKHGINSIGLIDQIASHTLISVLENLASFAGFQKTGQLLVALNSSQGALVSEIRESLTVNNVSTILQMLLQERMPIKNTVRILESILNNASKRDDPNYVLQKVRTEISDFISSRYAEKGFLPCVVVAPSLEGMLREGVRSNGEDHFLILEPKLLQGIVAQVKPFATNAFERNKDPVIITQQDIRRTLRNMLHENGIHIPVLAYQEINPKTIIYPIGFLGQQNANQDSQDGSQSEPPLQAVG